MTSTLALFLVLGGISFAAATLPKNSVGTKQIKKNGVKASDIRKNAVTSAKIRANAVASAKIKANAVDGSDVLNDALTGDDVNESTLGAVASAATASTVGDRFSAIVPMTVTASNIDTATARAAATEVPIVSHGQVSIYAKCFINSGINRVYAELYERTSTAGALAGGYSHNEPYEGNPSLAPSTPEATRLIVWTNSVATSPTTASSSGSSLVGTDGRGIMHDSVLYVQTATVSDPGLVFPAPDSCVVHIRGSKVG